MDYVLTNAQMRAADEYTIKELQIPSLTLMERAGDALAKRAWELAPSGEILVVCGGGNNGGDGFVCARILHTLGRKVTVVFFAEKASMDCAENKEKFLRIGGKIVADVPQKEYALVIDCLLGTGFSGALSQRYAEKIMQINACKKAGAKVLSADIPSGINGENGIAERFAVQADETLCIGEIKAGVYLADGIDYAGRIKRVDIGIELPKGESYAQLTDKAVVRALLPRRRRNSHKGNYGKAAIVAGSIEYTGAALLSAEACLRAGAGYTTLFVPENLLPYYVLRAPELLLKGINEGDRYAFNEEKMKELLRYDSIAFGMGMGATKETARGAKYLLRNYMGALILDADALNALAEEDDVVELFINKTCDVILTPHGKEFFRLTGKDIDWQRNNGVSAPTAFAKESGVNVLLKNAVSVLTDGRKTFVNTTGTSGQAKGGSGDVLSGVIAGLCAQGLTTFDAGVAGAYLVGKAAEIACRTVGEYSLLARDVIGALGSAFLSLDD